MTGDELDSENIGHSKSSKLQWTIKGIGSEVRGLSKKAAKRKGMHLGSWIESTLREAAMKELGGTESKSAQPDMLGKLEENTKMIRDLRADFNLLQRVIIEKLISK